MGMPPGRAHYIDEFGLLTFNDDADDDAVCEADILQRSMCNWSLRCGAEDEADVDRRCNQYMSTSPRLSIV